MSVRSSALRWLAATHGVRDADIFTSRLYPPEQSWTGRAAWWLQIPVHRVHALDPGAVHLVCEARAGGRDFHYLRVPGAYLRDHLADLDTVLDGRAVSLFLSAESEARYRDERGPGRLDFAVFAVPSPT
ncbi:MAG TPA: hypothetical protein VGD56_17340 [Gemmatirosa sp.]